MKVAVYDQFWATGGGGEKVAGGIARALRARGEVDVLGDEEIDLAALGERLRLDLSGLGQRVIPATPDGLEKASADYDLFVNASYNSATPSAARHSIYYVHFPQQTDRLPSGIIGKAVRLARPVMAHGRARVDLERGFHPPEQSGRQAIRWTTGEGRLEVRRRGPSDRTIRIDIGRQVPPELGTRLVRAVCDGEEIGRAVVTPRRSRLSPRTTPLVVDLPPGDPVELSLVAEPWTIADVTGGDDPRVLGVPVTSVQVGGGPRAVLGRAFPVLDVPPDSLWWLEGYDRIVANSAYTASWIDRLWHRPSDVLYPPVTLVEPGEKSPVILNVGRFFPADVGHSKKQLELIRAFRRLVQSGASGWELHLAGGCDETGRGYLDEARRQASGLPVEFHVDASGAELEDLYKHAAIYWHASGFGEDMERNPNRFEHFGITTVEAMSAGAAPVVIGAAGQAEVVEHGTSGFHFDTIEELVARTTQLIEDEPLRSRIGAAAVRRAQGFGLEAFDQHVLDLTDSITGDNSG